MKFVILAPSYNENIGGIIALHRLCHLLIQEGHDASIWPYKKPRLSANPLRNIYLRIKYANRIRKSPFQLNPILNSRIAEATDIDDAIVIYPEIIQSNPLNAAKVVRWFLYSPNSSLRKPIDYREGELYFYFHKVFNDDEINPDSDNQLQTYWLRDDIYSNQHRDKRSGSCHILRKGKRRKLIHDTSDSILIDGKSHTEIADIFNSVEYCISYDPHTLYSTYAALCGCTSIIVPDEDQKHSDASSSNRRPGIAYGFEQIEHARATQGEALTLIKTLEQKSNDTVKRFVKKCRRHFYNQS
ncbi:hypothetical protein BOW53_00375 [Solemya pervernicosa gill symbiont]|uniref:WavQ n=1 Tax=Solemya pervernicosa gill symbiont TaxID=642797 RepID=A0A1T2LB90_9GAMM|nr:hypothetical protein [Solemya pervernicosa gill symbiont]OOZ42330.1 hypothetical protein BOW53_00375 [Solemya pervernicosa gill symbiont]